MSIMRLWHGEVAIEKADEYEKFMIERAAPDYGSVKGLVKLYFQRKNEEKKAHFLLVTLWDSIESVKKLQVITLKLPNITLMLHKISHLEGETSNRKWMRGLNDRTKNSLVVALRNDVILAMFKPESSIKSMDPG